MKLSGLCALNIIALVGCKGADKLGEDGAGVASSNRAAGGRFPFTCSVNPGFIISKSLADAKVKKGYTDSQKDWKAIIFREENGFYYGDASSWFAYEVLDKTKRFDSFNIGLGYFPEGLCMKGTEKKYPYTLAPVNSAGDVEDNFGDTHIYQCILKQGAYFQTEYENGTSRFDISGNDWVAAHTNGTLSWEISSALYWRDSGIIDKAKVFLGKALGGRNFVKRGNVTQMLDKNVWEWCLPGTIMIEKKVIPKNTCEYAAYNRNNYVECNCDNDVCT